MGLGIVTPIVNGGKMDQIVLYPAQYARGDIAGDIATCTAILQEAASFVFSLPELRAGTFFIPAVETQPGYRVFNPPDHRVIVGEPATLRLERPYMVAFYGSDARPGWAHLGRSARGR